MSQPGRTSGGVRKRNRWNSIEFKLPFLMTGVIATVLTIALVVTYETLNRYAVNTVTAQLARATRQLATLGAQGVVAARARYVAAAKDSALHRVLGTRVGDALTVPPRADSQSLRAARAVLEKLVLPADSGMPVELWNAAGSRITYVGNDVRGPLLQGPGRAELPNPTNPAIVAGDEPKTDSLRLGPLYQEEDRVHFWMVMPVMSNGKPVGYIAHQRRIARNPAVEQTLRDLSGDSVTTYAGSTAP